MGGSGGTGATAGPAAGSSSRRSMDVEAEAGLSVTSTIPVIAARALMVTSGSR